MISLTDNGWYFYDTGNIKRYQLTKLYKMAVSFVLSNADFPPLSAVPKLHSTSVNAFSDRHISNAATVTPFLKTVLPISKNFAPEDKQLCQLLRNTCKSEFVSIKRHTVNHVLCKSFFSRDLISVVSQADVVNVNAKFTPLRSRVHVVKSHFRPLRVSVLKTTIFTVNTSPLNVCNVVSILRIASVKHLNTYIPL